MSFTKIPVKVSLFQILPLSGGKDGISTSILTHGHRFVDINHQHHNLHNRTITDRNLSFTYHNMQCKELSKIGDFSYIRRNIRKKGGGTGEGEGRGSTECQHLQTKLRVIENGSFQSFVVCLVLHPFSVKSWQRVVNNQ